jgi:uncharacterized membrane protein YphA (DoxX/SURF4 family)
VPDLEPSVLALAGTLILAGVFVVALVGKIRDASSFARFQQSMTVTLGLSPQIAHVVAVAVVVAEAAVPALLVLGVARPQFLRVGLALAAAVLVAFSMAIVFMLRRGVRESCHCFGSASRPVSRSDLVRNSSLLVIVVIAWALAPSQGRDSAWNLSFAVDVDSSTMGVILLALAGLTVLGVVNVALNVRITRQIAKQNELLRISIEGVPNPSSTMLDAGSVVSSFIATTLTGEHVSKADLAGETFVGFLSAGCPACAESMPAFILRAMEVGPGKVMAVVSGDGDAADQMTRKLAPVSQVIAEPEHGPVALAFGVTGYPAFGLLSDDTVVSSHFVVDQVARPD